jgi:hypothetical protein
MSLAQLQVDIYDSKRKMKMFPTIDSEVSLQALAHRMKENELRIQKC